MDEKYILQVLIDKGPDQEPRGAYCISDSLTDIMGVYCILADCRRDIISVRVLWGNNMIIEHTRDDQDYYS